MLINNFILNHAMHILQENFLIEETDNLGKSKKQLKINFTFIF